MSFTAIRRWHRSWYLPIEIVLLLLLAAGWWITSRSPMARLRASGAPMTFADLVADPIPDEENAAVVLREAAKKLEAFDVDLGEFYKTKAGLAYDQLDAAAALPGGTVVAIHRLIEQHAGLSITLEEVARRKQYASTTAVDRSAVTTSMRSVQQWRSLARYATFEQRVEIADGDVPAAIQTAKRTLCFGTHLANEPLVMRRMVAIAVSLTGLQQAERLILSVDLNTAQANKLDSELGSIEERPSVRTPLEAERVFSLDSLDQFPAYQGIFFRSGVLREFEHVLDLTELPSHQAASLIRTAQPTTSALAPSLDPLLTAETRLLAKARCMRIALALSQSGGPATAEALGLPAETLLDPFTGRPLLVEPTESPAGWRVASAGPDQLLGEGVQVGDAEDNVVVQVLGGR